MKIIAKLQIANAPQGQEPQTFNLDQVTKGFKSIGDSNRKIVIDGISYDLKTCRISHEKNNTGIFLCEFDSDQEKNIHPELFLEAVKNLDSKSNFILIEGVKYDLGSIEFGIDHDPADQPVKHVKSEHVRIVPMIPSMLTNVKKEKSPVVEAGSKSKPVEKKTTRKKR